MSKIFFAAVLSTIALSPGSAFAASGAPPTIDYFAIILHQFHIGHEWIPTLGGIFAVVVLLLTGLAYKSAVSRGPVAPDGRFSLRFVIDGILDQVHLVAEDNCGEKAKDYFPFLASLFLFILVCNLSGLIPGLPPATVSMATNVAIGVVVFFVYNYAGLKEHGAGYIKHFLGPVAFIAPLYFLIELISHGSRPLSLGLRLAGNIYGDHTLLGVFTGLSYVGFPALLLFFGLLVAVVQSFVFTLLTGIYISMATSHEH